MIDIAEDVRGPIKTVHTFPPIPIRSEDWHAYRENSYDADWDDELGRYVTDCLTGSGSTEAEAIADLIAKEGDEVCSRCNGSGEVGVSAQTLRYRGPGPVPEDSNSYLGCECDHCRGTGIIVGSEI
jgi:hypothetical protein